jgi:hypothetical protein
MCAIIRVIAAAAVIQSLLFGDDSRAMKLITESEQENKKALQDRLAANTQKRLTYNTRHCVCVKLRA